MNMRPYYVAIVGSGPSGFFAAASLLKAAESSDEVDVAVDMIEMLLFGELPSMTGPEVAERAGIPFEQARERWRSLGFTSVPEDEVAFTNADLRALEQTEKLRALGIADADTELALIRTIGRSFARLAEWQLDVLGRAVDLEHTTLKELGELKVDGRIVYGNAACDV